MKSGQFKARHKTYKDAVLVSFSPSTSHHFTFDQSPVQGPPSRKPICLSHTMSSKRSKASARTKQYPRMSAGNSTNPRQPTITIDYENPVVLYLEKRDQIAWLPSHVALVRDDNQGSYSSQIKNFIDPKRRPTLEYESDSLFVPQEREIPPSEADLDLCGWSPDTAYRLKPHESILFTDAGSKQSRLDAPTVPNEWLEVRSPCLTFMRNIDGAPSSSDTGPLSIAEMIPLRKDQVVVYDDERYTKSIQPGDYWTLEDDTLKKPDRRINLAKFIDAPTAHPVTSRSSTKEDVPDQSQLSPLESSRADQVVNRAITRSCSLVTRDDAQ